MNGLSYYVLNQETQLFQTERLLILKNTGNFKTLFGSFHINLYDKQQFILDTQRDNIVLTYRDSRNYKIANAFMLAWPYGYVRLMSSYDFPYDSRDKGKKKN